MQIIEYKDSPSQWNKFVIDNSSPASFLQSFEWGEFNRDVLGREIIRWAVVDEHGQIQAVIQAIKRFLSLGQYFYYCPRGIVYSRQSKVSWAQIFKLIIAKVKSKRGHAIFVRVNLPYDFVDYKDSFLSRIGFIKPKILSHLKEPGKTLVLDLEQSPEDLLKKMHPKTRYNIRLAERKGVKIKVIEHDPKYQHIDIFYQLMEETAERDRIKIYSKAYYQDMFKYFSNPQQEFHVKQYQAEFEGQVLSSIMLVYFGDTVTYLHGASANQGRNLMPNHLIQWQAICDAKKAGFKLYDFWGISERNPLWAGITRFKKGFDGKIISYLGTWDLVLHRTWYQVFYLFKLIKHLIP